MVSTWRPSQRAASTMQEGTGFAVHQNRAGAAFAAVAAGLYASEVHDLAQIVDQQLSFGDRVFAPSPVELQSSADALFSAGKCMHRTLLRQTNVAPFDVRCSMTKVKARVRNRPNIGSLPDRSQGSARQFVGKQDNPD